MKYIIGFLLLLSFHGLAISQQPSLTELINSAKPKIVTVFALSQEGSFLSQGTGFFIDSNGTVLSNAHIFMNADSAIIKTSAGEEFPVNGVVAVDVKSDLIKLNINSTASNYPFLSFATNPVQQGDNVFTIGNPMGLEYSVGTGIISALRDDPEFGEVIQFSAPISKGNSGSPLLNMNGEVIGVVTYQYAEGQNLNFAVAASETKELQAESGLWFPKELERSIPVNRETFQRAPWGTSIYMMHVVEKNSELNEFMTSFTSEMLALKNNYTKALCYDDVQFGDINGDIEYRFEHNYLAEIIIRFESADYPKTNPIAYTIQLFETFLSLKEYLTVLYGKPENSYYKTQSCSSCFRGSMDTFNAQVGNKTGRLTMSTKHHYYFGYMDQTQDTEIILIWGKPDLSNNSNQDTGMLQMYLTPLE